MSHDRFENAPPPDDWQPEPRPCPNFTRIDQRMSPVEANEEHLVRGDN